MISTNISVIVCTYNGGQKIIDCLNSLVNQTYNSSKYEIIVIDDGSIDNTKDLVRKFPVKLITNTTNQGLAESRNIGIKASSGKILAFTDDDCIPNKDWIETIYDKLSNSDVVGLTGKVLVNEKTNIIQRYLSFNNPLKPLEYELTHSNNILYRLKLYLERQKNISNFFRNKSIIRVSSVVGANMAFRLSTLDLLNGFDPKLTFGGEEEDLCYRLNKLKNNKLNLFYFSDIVVKHKFEKDITRSIKRNFLYGKGSYRLFLKYSERNITLLPFPIIFIFCLVIFLFMKWFLLPILLIPLVLYCHWFFINDKKFEFIFFPYIQLILESSFNLGVINEFIINITKKKI